MNTNDKPETKNQSITIEDLSAPNAEMIQGGGDDKRQVYLKIQLKEVMVSGWQ